VRTIKLLKALFCRVIVPGLLVQGACGPAGAGPQIKWPTSGWTSSTPEEQGLDSRKLAEAFDFLKAKEPNIHSLLAVRNGVIVVEAVFSPFSAGSRHDIASVTKSVTSTLIGIALRKGLIRSLGEPVLAYFPERKPAHLDDPKKSVALRHLLAMRGGFQCLTSPGEVTLMQMIGSPDWIQFMLDLPMAAKPGDAFVYNSGGVHLLSAILRKAAGRSALEFARSELFGPLGITDVVWPTDPQGLDNHGWGDLQLRPRDMAKIGYLFLNKGAWEGRSIMTPEWVDEATRPYPGAKENNYGFLWWLDPKYGYSARGRGGQYIYVLPRLNMVVVMTGGGTRMSDQVLLDYIMPAVLSPSAPLPPNPQAASLLRSKIENAARPPQPPSGTAPARPEMASKISGRWIRFEPNSFNLEAMRLDLPPAGEAALTIRAPGFGSRDVVFKIGFDGIPRLSEGRNGLPAAAQGTWASPETIALEIDEIGNINKFSIRLTFDASGAAGFIQEGTGLGRAALRGAWISDK